MNYKKIEMEDYKGEAIQYVGYYVLHHKDLELPEPEVFFVVDDEEEKTEFKPEQMDTIEKGAKISNKELLFFVILMSLAAFVGMLLAKLI